MHKKLIFGLLIFTISAAHANENILEKYVRIGLKSNLALQQKNISVNQSLQALKAARGMFLPSLSIEARYSRAGGGRTFEIPVGDLFNPLHATLNQLIQQQRFPTDLQNVAIPFLRKEEHDTKLRVVQPVFQPGIYYNQQAKKHLADAQRAERDVFARQLVGEIKQGYFTYLKTLQIERLLDETEKLLRENLRVSESLFKNQKVTEDAVLRAKVELSDLQQQQAEAQKNRVLAAAYFNFLINRALDDSIEVADDWEAADQPSLDLAAAENSALKKRDEFMQLQQSIRAAQSGVSAENTKYLPGVNAVFDYGFQGEKYRFGKNDDYWMASLVLSWNLFNGFQDRARVQQAKLAKKSLEARQAELKQQIALQVREVYYNMIVAGKNVLTANERVLSARKSFRIVERKYREGMAAQIEFLDTRTTLTHAEINQIVSKYDYQIALTEFERVTAAYPLGK